MNDFPLLHTVILRTPPTVLESIADFATVLAMFMAAAAVAVALYVHWDSSSPYVVVYLETDTDRFTTSLVVENLGKAPAYDISVEGFDLQCADEEFRPLIEKCFLFKGIPMLVQGKSRRTLIATNKYAQIAFVDKAFEVTVSYKKRVPLIGERNVKESFVLDYYSFAHTISSNSDLHDIARATKKLAGIK